MQQTQFSWLKTIRARFSRKGEFRRDPQLSWKAILLFCAIGMLAVLLVGYLTYYRAVQIEEETETGIVPRSALRPADVKVVIDTYQNKKERFTAVLANKPTFLSPGKGAVVLPREENTPVPSEATSSSGVLP